MSLELFDRIVTETVNSGNEPLKLTYVSIYDGHYGRPRAYRTQTSVFCASVGAVDPSYIDIVDKEEIGKFLTMRNITHLVREEKALFAADKKPAWVSVRATASFLTSESMYDEVRALLSREEFSSPETICLEFTKNIFTEDRESVRKGLADLKTLGIKTMLGNFATDGFPITTLLDVPVEYVVLTPEVTALALDRNKEDVLPSLVRFLRSMNVETIAAGVKSDAEIKELNKMECYGILPAQDYKGRFTFPLLKEHYACDYREVASTDEERAQ